MPLPFRVEAQETARLPALSDGVVAIAITLLAFDLPVPALPPDADLSTLAAALGAVWQDLFGYALSFLVIGLYWVLHRRVFLHLDRHDRGVVWLNLCFLLLVAFVPYATTVFARYPSGAGVTFYALVLALTGLTLTALWVYASGRALLEEGLSSRVVGIQAARFVASPLVFLASAVLATVSPTWAIASWLLLVPINGVLQSRLAETLETTAVETGR